MAVDPKMQALFQKTLKEKAGGVVKPVEGMSETEKQLWDIFEEKPVPLTEFIQGEEYLNLGADFTLSEIQYDFVRHMEQILFLDTYEKMSQVWGTYWTAERRVNNLVAAWGKGSAAPYERVYDAETGLWPRLDEIVETSVAAVSPGGAVHSKSITIDPFEEGYGKMFRVTTGMGRKIDVWEGHKFYTDKSSEGAAFCPVWKPLKDLKVKDKIALATYVPEPTNPIEIPDEHLELLAFFVASGNRKNFYGALSVKKKEHVKTESRILELLEKYFPGEYTTTTTDEINHTKHPRPAYVLSDKAKESFLKPYGLSEEDEPETRRLPEFVYRLNDRQLKLFVSRFTDVSGWVASPDVSMPDIGWMFVSEGFARDFSDLLLRFGVFSSIRYVSKTEKWLVRARKLSECSKLAKQLSLLDKQDQVERLLSKARVKLTTTPRNNKFGDIFWDNIKSIEPLGEDVYWSMTVDKYHSYITSGGIVNCNSGKNQTVVIAFARIAYLLLCLRDPQKYYRLASNSFIHMMNVALSAPQAHRAFFKPMRELFISAPWFADKFAEDTPPGPQATTIRLKKRIELISGHSQADSQEGNNLIAAVADEIAGFPINPVSGSEKAPMKTADGILKMLQTSALTRFPETYKLAQISFARYQGDPIMTALQEADDDFKENGDESTYYKSGPYSTWEVNPNYRRNFEFIDIPQSDKPVPNVAGIISNYKKKPAFSRGYYECKPEASENAYFKDRAKVEQSFQREEPIPPLTVSYYFGKDEDDPNEKYASWQVHYTFSESLRPVPGAVYAIHADMALKEDRAGIAMCHIEKYKEIETSDVHGEDREEYRPVVKMDFATAYEYDASAVDPEGNSVPREIQMRWFRKLVHELSSRGFEIGSVTQDSYGSLDSIQIMESWGYNSHRLSADIVSTQVWLTLRDLIYDGRFNGYKHKLLMDEMLSVEKTPKGKIDHPAGKSKDLLDAVACSATMAVECGGSEEEQGENITDASAFSIGAAVDDSFGVFGSGYNDFSTGAGFF